MISTVLKSYQLLTLKEKAMVCEYYVTNPDLSVREISEHLGITASGVGKILDDYLKRTVPSEDTIVLTLPSKL